MIELKGKYGLAKVFTDNIEEGTISQLIELLNQDFVKDSKIRIMPDVHQGKGCVIGFTADMGDKVIPNIVGVDIGCGVLTVELGNIDIDLPTLDNIINEKIPSGHNVHDKEQVLFKKIKDLSCYKNLKDVQRIKNSIGTLGGGEDDCHRIS